MGNFKKIPIGKNRKAWKMKQIEIFNQFLLNVLESPLKISDYSTREVIKIVLSDKKVQKALEKELMQHCQETKKENAEKIRNKHRVNPSTKGKPKLLKRNVDSLELSPRARNLLASNDICTLGQLCGYSEKDLRGMKNFGKMSVNEVNDKLKKFGLTLSEEKPEKKKVKEKSKLLKKNISTLSFSVRVENALLGGGVRTIGQLCALSETSVKEIDGIGTVSFKDIKKILKKAGLTLAPISKK